MAKKDEFNVQKSPSSSRETEKSTIRGTSCCPSSSDEDGGSPIRYIVCVKKYEDVKRFEETDDCFILDFDPLDQFQSFPLSKISVSAVDNSIDLAVIAEKGQVACRDYPHSRYQCVKYPFETTPHERYCELCYCYVCDSTAPCLFWNELISAHCHASEHEENWKLKRNSMKMTNNHLPNTEHSCSTLFQL